MILIDNFQIIKYKNEFSFSEKCYTIPQKFYIIHILFKQFKR